MVSDSTQEASRQAKDALRTVVGEFGGDALRDLWVFDGDTQEHLFLRSDVADELEAADVERFVDNERYGFVTRDTYNRLHYAEFYYTVRGFDSFEQYRTFVSDDAQRIGVLCSFDRRGGGFDFAELTERVVAVSAEYPVDGLLPE